MVADLQSVAVIGMSGAFPGAPDLAKFWENLLAGRECLRSFTEEELARAGVPQRLYRHSNYVNVGGPLEGADLFDADFFGFSPREAAAMDPQHRVFLEHVWLALEDAGYDATRLKGLVGVYAGESLNTYLLREILGTTTVEEIPQAEQVLFGNVCDHLATRVAYNLNLHGPALTIQTACSTSLVAIHQAYQALVSMQCDMAVAGGVSVKFPQESGYMWKQDSILSSDGHCRAFDSKADGTIFTNGVGVVVLKPLEQALADGDSIYAVIKGAAINNDGARKVGYTAPSIVAQAEVIATAQSLAEINPETITYVESHGTGTALGDPIEVAALTNAFRLKTRKNGFCAITSLKSNLGHLDAAAGVASFIKVCLALQHHVIPPSINFESANRQIDFNNSPFYVNTEAAEWRSRDVPRRAGVSSFGIGGTNAHVVLEEAPPSASLGVPASAELLVLSSRSENGLRQMTDRLVSALRSSAGAFSLRDVSYTLGVGRRQFAHRTFLVCESIDRAVQLLETGSVRRGLAEAGALKIVFCFPDSIADAVRSFDSFYRENRVFREAVEQCWSAIQELRSSYTIPDFRNSQAILESKDSDTEPFRTLTLMYSTAVLLRHWGIKADALAADGTGKLAAGCFADVFSVTTAFNLLLAARDQKIDFIKETFAAPGIPIFALNSGNLLDATAARKPEYWLRSPAQAPQASPEVVGRSAIFLSFSNSPACLQNSPIMGSDASVFTVLAEGHSDQGTTILRVAGELWLRGIQLSWEAMIEPGMARRCHLPGYFFEQKRHWFEPPKTASQRASESEPANQRLEMSNWFYIPAWRATGPANKRSTLKTGAKWLIFADACGVSGKLAKVLHERGDSVRLVEISDTFFQTGTDRFGIRPSSRDDYLLLINQLKELGCWPDFIVHLWCLDPADASGADCHAFEAWQYRGLFSLIYLFQAMGQHNRDIPLEIAVLTTEMNNVSGLEVVAPNKSTLLGPIKIIPKEYKHIRCRMVDFDVSAIKAPVGQEAVVRHLLDEIDSDHHEEIVAYRGLRRWIPSYESVRITAPADSVAGIRREGTYLILGALGTLGLDAAEFLAMSAPVHLVLVDKKTLPERSLWEEATGEMQPLIQRLLRYEAAGAKITFFNADFGHRNEVEELARYISSEHMQIHGIVHAAGHVDNGIIELRTPESLHAVFAAKVHGAYALQKLLAGQKPDFVFLCSSMNPIIGSLGQVDKASANAFLDSFAEYYSTTFGQPVMAVSWGAVDDTRASQIMVLPQFKNLSRLHRMNKMTREESAEVYRRILTAGIPPRLIVSTLPFNEVIESWNKVGTLDDLLGGHPWKAFVLEGHNGSHIPSLADIRRVFADILGVSDVHPEDNFFSLGGHSLSAIELIEAVASQFGIQLRLNDIYNYATAELLHKEVAGRAASARPA